MGQAYAGMNRRDVLKGLGAAGALAGLAPLYPRAAAAADKLVVGVIYVGPRDDYGYNQAQAQAAAALKKMPGVTVVEQEKVPETIDVQKTMGSMIEQDGATLLFPTSFGYFDPHILKMAEKYPKVRFAHCGGLWTEGKHPKNVGSYFGYIDECQYLNGVVAGHASKTKKLGFIAAKPIPAGAAQHQRLHARRAQRRPEDHHAAHLHRRLVAAGQGGRGRQQPDRSGRGRAHLPRRQPQGHRGDGGAPRHLRLRLPRQPGGARAQGLSHRRRVELDHAVHHARARTRMAGKPMVNFLRGGLKEGFVKTVGLRHGGDRDSARKNADAVKAQMMKGDFVIFKGPLKDNTGKTVIAAGDARRSRPTSCSSR